MARGFSDVVIVVVKVGADEGMVTYLRGKLPLRGRDAGGEGQHAQARTGVLFVTAGCISS